MKIYLLLALIIFTCCLPLSATVYVPGSHNDWDLDSGNEVALKSDLGVSQSYYGITIQPSIDNEFKIVEDSWSNAWGSGYWITSYDRRWSISWIGDNAVWKGSPDSYTHLCIEDPADYHSTNIPVGIMTLGAAPVSVSSVSDDSSVGEENTNVTISITLGSTKGDENVYVRYTSDSWSSDTFVLATGSGTSYSASVTVSGSGTIEYYVLTTTLLWAAASDLDNYTDLMTIEYDNNSGSNYTYDYNDDPLPVYLSSFYALYIGSTPTINWVTQTESDNIGWNVYRSVSNNFGQAQILNLNTIPGNGTTSEPSFYSFTDEYEAQENSTYWYWLESISGSGETESFGPVLLTITPDGNEIPEIPLENALHQNFPNPFNPSTLISFEIKENETGVLSIYNIKGQLIVKEEFGEGRHSYTWDAKDHSSGIYLYKLQANRYSKNMKMLLVK